VDLIPAPPLDDRVTPCETGASTPQVFVPRCHLPVPDERGFPIPPVYRFREQKSRGDREFLLFSSGYRDRDGDAPSTRAMVFPDLNNRQHEVLDLIAQGYTNTAIAAWLFLSPNTVANHVSTILTKLQVTHRGQAIVRAREAGLGLDRR
jgi:DNA-binding CsgD family transcriptional regulator